MVQTARASVPDRFASPSGQNGRIPNSVDHRLADKGVGSRKSDRPAIVHRVTSRDVVLRRVATRRRLARIDPEAVERRAWRLIGGGAGSTMQP